MRFLADAGTGVGDFEAYRDVLAVLRDAGHADHDCALPGKLDRVAHQIGQHLAQTQWVSPDVGNQLRGNTAGKLQSLEMGALGKEIHNVLERRAQIHVDILEFELSSLDLGEVQKVVDDVEQVLARALHGLGVLALSACEPRFQQQLRHAQNAVHRRADLVAHPGEERAFRVVCCFRRFARQAQRFLALLGRGEQSFDAVRHVVERFGGLADFGRARGIDAHRMVAPTEAVRAFGKHVQRSEIAAEDQPDELQHEEQRHGHDLQLLDELLPKPVMGVDRSHVGTEPSVSNPARRDIDTLSHVLDGGNAREPARRDEHIRCVLSDQRLAPPVGPGELFDLAFLDLVCQQLADRRVFTDERLIGNQRREEGQGFPLLAQQPGGMLGRTLRHQQDGLHAASQNDRDSHGKHEARNQSPRIPESEPVLVFHGRFPCVISGGQDYLTSVVL